MRADQLRSFCEQMVERSTPLELACAMMLSVLDTGLERPWKTAAPLQRIVDRCEIPR